MALFGLTETGGGTGEKARQSSRARARACVSAGMHARGKERKGEREPTEDRRKERGRGIVYGIPKGNKTI